MKIVRIGKNMRPRWALQDRLLRALAIPAMTPNKLWRDADARPSTRKTCPVQCAKRDALY